METDINIAAYHLVNQRFQHAVVTYKTLRCYFIIYMILILIMKHFYGHTFNKTYVEMSEHIIARCLLLIL